MASYAGDSFHERGDAGHNNPGWEAKYNVVEKTIPNGAPVIQAIGALARRLAMPIRCSASELAALYGDIDGSAHTLVWSGGSESALLESISAPSEVHPNHDYFFVTLNFIKL